jgi:hypothetical protein
MGGLPDTPEVKGQRSAVSFRAAPPEPVLKGTPREGKGPTGFSGKSGIL